jgi:hypothetical protein
MASGKQDFMDAMRTGDAAFVRDYLRQNPAELSEKLSWDGHDGFPLHYAAFYNQPAIISLLVKEFGADPNRNKGVGASWTPLHHAKKAGATAAAGRLLALGANPSLSDDRRETTADFCASRAVMQYRDPSYLDREKARDAEALQKRLDGTWTRTGAREVTHDYELPDLHCRLKDIFNFETRTFRAIVKSADSVSQNILFFDDMPDQVLLRQPAEKLKEKGGEVSDDEISGGRPFKKLSGPKLS